MAENASTWADFGGKLSVCRQNKNMTQEVLAGKLGVTSQALSKWERGLSLPDITMLPDLARILEVSVDWLLGMEEKSAGKACGEMQEYIGNSLRNSLEPVELIFGIDLVKLFLDNQFEGKIRKVREKLACQGVFMPIVRIRDEAMLEGQEFMVLAYQNVLYSESLQAVDEGTLDYMIGRLESCVREKYYEIISPDIVKNLVDNLKMKYPALIEGVVPEKISYGLLTDVLKKHLRRGNSAMYLPKVIEIVDCALRENPNLTAAQLEEQIAQTISRPDNFWLVMKERGAK